MHRVYYLRFLRLLLPLFCLCALSFTATGLAQSDERTADIARVLDLGEAYRTVGSAFRKGEITQAEMRAQQQEIQSEGRAIRGKYGPAGNRERIAFDRDVTKARTARDRAQRRAAAAERQQKRVAARAAEVAEQEAQRDTRPQLVQDIEASMGFFHDIYDMSDPQNPTAAEAQKRAAAGQTLAALLARYKTGGRTAQRLEFEMALEAEYVRRFGAQAEASGITVATYVPRAVVEFPKAEDVVVGGTLGH